MPQMIRLVDRLRDLLPNEIPPLRFRFARD
jgi:hypothetical protein